MFSRTISIIGLISLFSFTACKKEDVGQDYKMLGSSAPGLLSSSVYTVLKIEIHFMPGYAPDDTSLNKLVNFLKAVINKPLGIQVTQQPIPASNKTSLSITDIVNLEKKYRTSFTGLNEISVHVLITDTDHDASDNLATAYWNTSLCIFGKTLSANSGAGGQVTRPVLLTTLLEHEFGHLMGLVNQGSPMQVSHKDPANGAHCTNRACLMYHEIESTNYTNGNTSGVPFLDANCLADLKANGGK
jgi:hypothetical protein